MNNLNFEDHALTDELWIKATREVHVIAVGARGRDEQNFRLFAVPPRSKGVVWGLRGRLSRLKNMGGTKHGGDTGY